MSIVAISAGLGSPSSSQLLAKRIIAALLREDPSRSKEEMRLVELRDVAHDLLNAELSQVPSPAVRQLLADITGAEALIVVTPVLNAQPAAVFSLCFEVLDKDALRGKPVLLAATGGTTRHSLVLDRAVLPMFHYLHAVVAPVSVFAATEDWASTSLDTRVHQAAASLLSLLRPTDPGPTSTGPTSTSAKTTPSTDPGPTLDSDNDNDFETMLARVAAGRPASTR